MKIHWKIVALAVLVFCAAGDVVFAWGPATHIGIGESALSQLALLPGAVAAILARNAVSYLFGSIAADVVFAKRLSKVKQFCHHWSTGFKLLERAEDDRAQAFAYGYLSHLAADTVAHGKYVPHQIMTSGTSHNFGHFYWELRADSMQPEPSWIRLQSVISEDHDHHHMILRDHITDTLLSYPVNRALFGGMNALAVRQGFRRTVDTWGRLSRWPLRSDLLQGYNDESLDRVLSLLHQGSRSSVLREDPNGTAALLHARERRAQTRKLVRGGLSVEHRLREVSHALAPRPRPQRGRTTESECTNGRNVVPAGPRSA